MNTNKIDLIKAEVEKLKSQLLRGACSSQIAMETMCKEEAYNEVLAILDTMQEEQQVKESAEFQHVNGTCKENGNSLTQEPVSEVWHYQKKEPVNEIVDKSRPIIVVYGNNSLNAAGKFRYYEDNSDAIWLSNSYEKWAFVEDLINLTHSVTKVSWQEEPVSEGLEEAANEWNVKASFTPFYMALDDKGNPNGVKQDYTTHAESFKAGAKWQKEKDSIVMMANSADAMIGLPYENKDGGYTHLIDVSRPLPVGNNKIAIIFKED